MFSFKTEKASRHSFMTLISKSTLGTNARELDLNPGWGIHRILLNKTLNFFASVPSIQMF